MSAIERAVRFRVVTSDERCPVCRADVDDGWDPYRGVCSARLARSVDAFHERDQVSARRRVCGYVHRALLRKPAYSVLSDLFDCVIVDEGTKIKGDDSYASKSVRAIRAPYRLLSTGTPIKNFVPDLFWLLWWALGNATPRFPYSYRGGKERFMRDFAVVETRLDSSGRKAEGARPKILPEVSNLLRLWRILCSSVVRRRMDEVGAVLSLSGEWSCAGCKEKQRCDVSGPIGWSKPAYLECSRCRQVFDAIVPTTYVPVHVPWGKAQKRFYANWLSTQNFARHFLRKHPNSPLAATPGMIPVMAAGLGQLAKLSYATTDPIGDPDPDYKTDDLSPWTPGRFKILELAAKHAARGEQILIGSSHVAPGPWIAGRLRALGIQAVHICEVGPDGKMATMAPRRRARAVADFRAGRAQVLCTGVHAMSLGHNLDCASVVIVDGLPYDFATWDQYLKRARRLTSKRPITVYIIIPADSLTTKIWTRLKHKTAASDLALDGRLSHDDEEPIDRAAILRELQELGARVDGSEVLESDVRAMWEEWLKAISERASDQIAVHLVPTSRSDDRFDHSITGLQPI